jgi:hypothetical protein
MYPVVPGRRFKPHVWLLWASPDGGGARGGESPKDQSEVRDCPNLSASRHTGPGRARRSYSMMMLVSTMLRSLSTSSGNLQRPAIYVSPLAFE